MPSQFAHTSTAPPVKKSKFKERRKAQRVFSEERGGMCPTEDIEEAMEGDNFSQQFAPLYPLLVIYIHSLLPLLISAGDTHITKVLKEIVVSFLAWFCGIQSSYVVYLPLSFISQVFVSLSRREMCRISLCIIHRWELSKAFLLYPREEMFLKMSVNLNLTTCDCLILNQSRAILSCTKCNEIWV